MRRTYGSKKATAGGLDHREMISMIDEKSSVFDAFYIQNIKQTKRELSCMGSSNRQGVTSSKVRKRKYVKRIVKEVQSPVRESLSESVFLTPDRSIRVNKAPDLFDQLLNSSPACNDAKQLKKVDLFDKLRPEGPTKTYNRKKVPPKKKFNYSSSDDTRSDKENSVEKSSNETQNVTDIRAHKLLIEREHHPSLNVDESINKIIQNLSLLHNLNSRKSSTGSIKRNFKCNTNRLTKNMNTPRLQSSPLSSTPFIEKFRSKSIYKFSPIPMGNLDDSPNYVATGKDNENVVFVPKSNFSKLNKSQSENRVSPVTHLVSKYEINKTNVNKLVFDEGNITPECSEDSIISSFVKVNKQVESVIDSLQISEAEPFLGFANDSNEPKEAILLNGDTINRRKKTDISDKTKVTEKIKSKDVFEDSSIELTEPIKLFYGFSNVESNNEDKESSFVFSITKKSNSSNNKETSAHLHNIIKDVSQHDSEINCSYENTQPTKSFLEPSNNKTENETSSDSDDKSDISNESNISHESQERESLYNTCNSEQSSLDENEMVRKEPIVTIKKMDLSLFQRYYKKMPNFESSSEETSESQNSSNDYASMENNSSEDISGSLTDSPKAKSGDSTYNIDIGEIENNESMAQDNPSHEEECISFVTTRKRQEITNNSAILVLDDSFASSNSGCDKTVLSNHKIDEEENCDNAEGIELEKENINKMSPEANISEDSVHNAPRISFVTTRKSTKVFRDSSVSKTQDTVDVDKPVIVLQPEKKWERSLSIYRRATTMTDDFDHSLPEDEDLNSKGRKPAANISEDSVHNEPRISFVTTRKSTKVFRDSSVSKTQDTVDVDKPVIVLQPGKKWERSLSIYRRATTMTDDFDHSLLEDEDLNSKGRKYRQSVINTLELQETIGSISNESFKSRRSTFISKPSRSTIRIVKEPNARLTLSNTTVLDDLKAKVSEAKCMHLYPQYPGFLEDCDDTVVELSKLSIAESDRDITVLEKIHDSRVTTARDYVLRRCNQTDTLLFDECYPDTLLKNCQKIGEGVYGEVYLYRGIDGRPRVMKIVPIAGSIKVNGEHQKDFDEVISEIVIAMELSALRAPIAEINRHFDEGKDVDSLSLQAVENATDVFNEVLAVKCVYGNYPSLLLDRWDLYDEIKGSENDNPAILPPDQQYIVLELANAGQDLESYQFNNAEQAHALFYQVAYGLAVAEEAFQFEHRDLHWGNVLIAPTDQKYATFVLRGRAHRVPRCGVAASIIDYSLSRISLPLAGGGGGGGDSAALYNDLASDDGLFDAVGDYQFSVYRLMREKLGNDWKNYEPYTNILWLHYVVDKMITALRYKRTNTKTHKQYINKLKEIKERILNYGSATLFVLT